MAIDTSIYQLAGRGVKSVADFDNEAAQAQQNKLAQVLNGYKVTEAQNAIDDRQRGLDASNTMARLLAGSKNPDDVATGLAKEGYDKEALAYRKQLQDQAETAAKIGHLGAQTGKISAETIGLHLQQRRDELGKVNDPQGAEAWVTANYTIPELKPLADRSGVTMEQALANIPKDPVKFNEWKNRNGLTTEQLIKLTTPDANTVLTANTSRANTQDNNATTQRGQNMTAGTAAAGRAEPKGQVIQTDSGVMLVDPRTGVARPVTAGGEPLRPKLRQIPAAISKAVLENNATLRTVTRALEELDVYPDAFGAKNYLGDSIRQRSDPKGIAARAYTADIGSLLIHDRSGAAVTASETPRLKPFIPSVIDAPDTIKKKLMRFKEEYEAINRDIAETYSTGQGYRAGGGTENTPPAATKPFNYQGQTINATLAPDGKYYIKQPNGRYAEVTQ